MNNLTNTRARRPRAFILIIGVALVVGVWFFREPLRQEIRERATLANDAPTPEVVADMIEQASDPRAALLAAWNSGKIVHRQVAVREIRNLVNRDDSLPSELESVLLSAALDPDMSVRELALGQLAARRHPALPALAAAQLKDSDPEIRNLGLTHLRSADASVGVPAVIPLLDDPDLRVVGMSLKLLENWSGKSFGSRLSDTIQMVNEQTGLKEYQGEGIARIAAAVERARVWWAEHQDEFPAVELALPEPARHAPQLIPAGDFRLPALNGDKVRLSDFRGRVVLVNFWTTWCTACLAEIPVLVALQEKHIDELVILGVSLDYVPDSHGHIGGHAAVEDQDHSHGHHDDAESDAAALRRVREKIARTVKARGINYPILLDEKNEVGGRFLGGELPTTVIIDADGFVRRRFIGARSLPVFEAMIEEASRGLPAEHTKHAESGQRN